MEPKKIVNIIGAAAVVLGVFSPLFTVPLIGSISYAAQMQGEGFLLAGAAVISGLLALANIYWPSIVAAAVVLLDLGMTLNNIHERLSGFANSDNPFVQAFTRAISPSFGFALLGIGAIMLIISVFMRTPAPAPVAPTWDTKQIYGTPTQKTEEEQAAWNAKLENIGSNFKPE